MTVSQNSGQMEILEPTFPALIVYEDSSIASFTALTGLTHDVDQWYWSNPEDYIIDSLGRKFVQDDQRGSDQRPIEIPTWRFDSEVDEGVTASLVSSALGVSDWLGRDHLGDLRSRIRYMIDLVVEFDAQ